MKYYNININTIYLLKYNKYDMYNIVRVNFLKKLIYIKYKFITIK